MQDNSTIPLYQLLDPLPADQYQALKADIAKRGILVPVELLLYFRQNHMVCTAEQYCRIKATCEQFTFSPMITDLGVEAHPFRWVWYGLIPMEYPIEDCYIDVGWEQFIRIVHGTTPTPSITTETDIEASLCAKLENDGLTVRRQVHTPAGVIDILTPTAIYEVKLSLGRDQVLKGIGQLIIYSSAFPDRELVLIGPSGDGISLGPFAAQQGIKMVVFDPPEKSGTTREVYNATCR